MLQDNFTISNNHLWLLDNIATNQVQAKVLEVSPTQEVLEAIHWCVVEDSCLPLQDWSIVWVMPHQFIVFTKIEGIIIPINIKNI